jgi:hypothetical protein
MVPADLITPLILIGRELRLEFTMVLDENRAGTLARHLHAQPAPPSEPRPDDRHSIERCKAAALLQSVRHGAVRR